MATDSGGDRPLSSDVRREQDSIFVESRGVEEGRGVAVGVAPVVAAAFPPARAVLCFGSLLLCAVFAPRFSLSLLRASSPLPRGVRALLRARNLPHPTVPTTTVRSQVLLIGCPRHRNKF